MSARERVMILRLLEKTEKYSEYAKRLGLQVVMSKVGGKEPGL